MATKVNLRKKKPDAISTKIAMFYATDTYADGEEDARQLLTEAIGKLDAAVLILVANDEKAESKQS